MAGVSRTKNAPTGNISVCETSYDPTVRASAAAPARSQYQPPLADCPRNTSDLFVDGRSSRFGFAQPQPIAAASAARRADAPVPDPAGPQRDATVAGPPAMPVAPRREFSVDLAIGRNEAVSFAVGIEQGRNGEGQPVVGIAYKTTF